MNSLVVRMCLLASLVVVSVLLTGCPLLDKTVLVTGAVVVGEPLEGADIAVYSPRGTFVARYLDETQMEGTYVMDVPVLLLSEGMRLVVRNGRGAISGRCFEETLVAEVPPAGEGLMPVIHVGFASTLAAAYRAAHEEVSIEESHDIVSDFLMLPETVELRHDLLFYDDHFDSELFYEASQQFDSLNDFMAALVDEIDAGETHPFYSAEAEHKSAAGEKGLMGSFVTGLAQGAGEQIGSRATGWVLDKIFGPSGTPARPDAAAVAAIQEVGSEVKALKADLEAFESEVNKALTQILIATEQTQYDTLVSSLSEDIAFVETMTSNFWVLCAHTYENDADFGTLATSLRNHLDPVDLETRLRKFNNILAGTQGGGSSAIDKWGFLQTRHAAGQRNEQALYVQFQYFAGLEINLLNLLLEAYHVEYSSGVGAADKVDLYREFMLGQSNLFLMRVEGMMALMQNWEALPSQMIYLYEWNSYNADILLASPSRESAVLQTADAIVGEALGIEKAVMLRLATPNSPNSVSNPSMLNAVALSLRNTVTSAQFTPDYVYKNRVDQPDLGTVVHQFTPWDINRYVFFNLAPGQYALVNVNSQYPCPRPGFEDYLLLHSAYLTQTISTGSTGFRNMLITAYAWPGNPVG